MEESVPVGVYSHVHLHPHDKKTVVINKDAKVIPITDTKDKGGDDTHTNSRTKGELECEAPIVSVFTIEGSSCIFGTLHNTKE